MQLCRCALRACAACRARRRARSALQHHAERATVGRAFSVLRLRVRVQPGALRAPSSRTRCRRARPPPARTRRPWLSAQQQQSRGAAAAARARARTVRPLSAARMCGAHAAPAAQHSAARRQQQQAAQPQANSAQEAGRAVGGRLEARHGRLARVWHARQPLPRQPARHRQEQRHRGDHAAQRRHGGRRRAQACRRLRTRPGGRERGAKAPHALRGRRSAELAPAGSCCGLRARARHGGTQGSACVCAARTVANFGRCSASCARVQTKQRRHECTSSAASARAWCRRSQRLRHAREHASMPRASATTHTRPFSAHSAARSVPHARGHHPSVRLHRRRPHVTRRRRRCCWR